MQSRSRVARMAYAILALLVAGCSSGPAEATATPASVVPSATPASTTFTDPFAYCAAVGTLDKPDARYAGIAVPDAVINGFKQAAGLAASTEPLDTLRQTTIWRCMGGKVYVCNFGANLPCDSKADTNSTPSPDMAEYCKANPGSDFIPMSVTGHATIYSWHCLKDAPQVLDQVGAVDAAGYLAQIWYEIPASP